jgi:thioredoxin reductase (NADPH)
VVHLSYRGAEVHERVKYWIRPELEALIEEGRIHGHPRTIPTTIDATCVALESLDGGPSTTLEIDDVLLMIGYEHDPTLMKELGIKTDPETDAPQFNEQTMETNIPGLHVAGTATAGTQDRFRVFIENCHVHAQRITAAIAGGELPAERSKRKLEES